MSYGWAEVVRWSAGPLDTAFADLTSRRDELLECQDELDAMGTPTHWVGDAAEGARSSRRALTDDLEVLVAQISAARRALATASDAMPGLERAVENARSHARDHGLAIGTDGSVEDVEGIEDNAVGFDARDQLAERNGLVATCADLVQQAIDAAERIDRDLCVVFDGIRDDEVEVDADTLSQASLSGYLEGVGGLGPPPSGATPQQNADWWDELTGLQREYVLEHHPDLLGNRDGIPYVVRDEANRDLMAQRRTELEDQLEALQADLEEAERSSAPGAALGVSRVEGEISDLEDQLGELERIEEQAALDDHHVIGVDFSHDRAEAIIAQGDLDSAQHIATFTPGLTSTVDSLDHYGGQLADIRADSADALLARMTPQEIQEAGGYAAARAAALDDVAVVTWLGYQAPQWGTTISDNSVATEGTAEEGGAALADFFRGIGASRGDDPDITALGHSYGSTTTGNALQEEGTGVDRAGFFGSPGLGVSDSEDLHVPAGGLYYAEAKWDGVGDLATFGTDPSNLEGITQMPTGAATALDGTELDEVTGHSDYMVDGSTSAYNLSQLVIGSDDMIDGSNTGPLDFLNGLVQ